jgi:hypothetical protein
MSRPLLLLLLLLLLRPERAPGPLSRARGSVPRIRPPHHQAAIAAYARQPTPTHPHIPTGRVPLQSNQQGLR